MRSEKYLTIDRSWAMNRIVRPSRVRIVIERIAAAGSGRRLTALRGFSRTFSLRTAIAVAAGPVTPQHNEKVWYLLFKYPTHYIIVLQERHAKLSVKNAEIFSPKAPFSLVLCAQTAHKFHHTRSVNSCSSNHCCAVWQTFCRHCSSNGLSSPAFSSSAVKVRLPPWRV